MLLSLKARNFKSWRDTGDVRLAPLTGLFGTNSSGKTSLLQLLLLLKQTAESADRQVVLHLGGQSDLVELGTFKDLLFGHATEDAGLELGLGWSLERELSVTDPDSRKTLFSANEIQFTAIIEQAKLGEMRVREMAYALDGHRFAMRLKEGLKYQLVAELVDRPGQQMDLFEFRRSRGRAWELPPPTKCYGFPDQVRYYYQNAGFLSDLELSFEELMQRIYYLGPLRDVPRRQYSWSGSQPSDMGRRGERAVDAILTSGVRGEKISRGRGRPKLSLEAMVAWWLKELGLIADFRVESIADGSNVYRVLVRRSPGSSEVLITDVGFGVSQILPVLTLCYYVPPGSVVLLEQPEIHLHPSVQAGLADVLIHAIKQRKIQIILESHSEHLLRRLQRRVAEEGLEPESTALYFCEMQRGRSKIVPLTLNMFGDIVNWPESFFGDEFGEIAAITEAQIERRRRQRSHETTNG
jgi:predicted ATPase